MRNRRTLVLLSSALLLMMLGFSACSSDDDGGGTPAGDTTAPLVTGIDPSNATDVAVDRIVYISFSEDMDQATADGNVTLSQGTITDLTWTDAKTLQVTHSDWPQAVEVTVTATTGLKDLAGNALPSAWTSSFWTHSDAPALLETDPADDATGVVLNYTPRMHFSQAMNASSLWANTAVTEVAPLKAVPGYRVEPLGDDWYGVVFSGDLTAETTYEVAVSGDAEVYDGSTTLGTGFSFRFTTGAVADEEPPTVVSVVPAVGATVNSSQSTIVISFSEPIMYDELQPVREAALMEHVVGAEPVWNAEHDQLTVYLQTPLPTGVRLFAVFGPSMFADQAGNWNTSTDSVSFRVSGSPDYFPVRTDWAWYYSEQPMLPMPVKAEYGVNLRRYISNISLPTFDRYTEEYRYENDVLGWYPEDHDYLSKDGDAYWFRGFVDGDSGGDVIFTPRVKYQDLPFVAGGTWSGTATIPNGEGTATLTYNGHTIGQETILLTEPQNKLSVPTVYVLEDCWTAVLYHEITAGDATVEAVSDTVTYAPGIGIVREYTGGSESNGQGGMDAYWTHVDLQEIDFDWTIPAR